MRLSPAVYRGKSFPGSAHCYLDVFTVIFSLTLQPVAIVMLCKWCVLMSSFSVHTRIRSSRSPIASTRDAHNNPERRHVTAALGITSMSICQCSCPLSQSPSASIF